MKAVWGVLAICAALAAVAASLGQTEPGRAAWAYIQTPKLKIQSAQVAYQPGAEALAAQIDAALPGAMAAAETALGFRFRQPPQIRLFSDGNAYRFYTGLEGRTAGVTILGRVSLSPQLIKSPRRARAVLTHELTHALLVQTLGLRAALLPAWFDEGLAVLASKGAGAEDASKRQALMALKQGRSFEPDGSETPFRRRAGAAYGLPEPLFYRQAELFVGYLRARDPAAFRRCLDALPEARSLGDALIRAYGQPVSRLYRDWREAA